MVNESSSLTKEYRKSQRVIALVFFIIVIIASIVTLGGVVWTFADIFIGATGKWDAFLALNLGYQIAIIGGLLAGLFFLLIFFFGLFKKTSRSLIHFIYRKRELEEKYKNLSLGVINQFNRYYYWSHICNYLRYFCKLCRRPINDYDSFRKYRTSGAFYRNWAFSLGWRCVVLNILLEEWVLYDTQIIRWIGEREEKITNPK